MDVVKSFKGLSNWTDFENSQVDLTSKEKGDRFEYITKLYFQLHHKYSTWIKDVWLSHELDTQIKKKLSLDGDIGFDLILRDKLGNYIPVQCKYHSDRSRNVGWKEASTFFGLYNSSEEYQTAYLCSNAYGVSSNFESVNSKPIYRILGLDWSRLDSDFFSLVQQELFGTKAVVEPYSPLPHQSKAISDALTYFNKQKHTRGKLIFPCGSGKSLTGYWLTRDLKSQTTLIAVPSLSLVKQTLDVYLRETVANGLNVEWLCICSDTDIGKSAEVKYSTEDLGIPSTTDPDKIKQWLTDTSGKDRFVFSTYQSGQIIAEVSKSMDLSFDLGIFDEAHKTVGNSDKLFSHLLFAKNINIDKRIFMTATERFYAGSKDEIASMDDVSIYGNVFSKMSFKDAIDSDLLTDYKIITIDIKSAEIAEFIKKNKLVELNPKYGKQAESRSLASMIALRKAMKKLPIKNAVSFHSSIDKARRAITIQGMISSEYDFDDIDTFTVSGKDSVGKRDLTINEFARSNSALITNARCLTEGVDIPKIDCIVFSDPKRSKVDIVQALGRALRKKEGKKWGYVILPVVYDEKTHEIDNDNYKEILSIVRGLAANDERIIEYFKSKTNLIKRSSTEDINEVIEELSESSVVANQLDELRIKIWNGLSRFSWMSFDEAREYAHGLRLNSYNEWLSYFKVHHRPDNLPSSPPVVYSDRWLGWGDFLGTGNVRWGSQEIMSFVEARNYARGLKLSSEREWRSFIKVESLPNDLPRNPAHGYSDEWKGWGDFLGTNRLNTSDFYAQIWSYDKSKEHMIIQKITSQSGFSMYKKSDDFPSEIPRNPALVYGKTGDWISWGHFFNTGRIATNDRVYMSYEKARKWASSLILTSEKDWRLFVKSNPIPHDIPRTPYQVYKDQGWNGFSDFLGYEGQKRIVRENNFSFYRSKARKFCKTHSITVSAQWKSAFREGCLPNEINLSSPDRHFSDDWISWGDFLGSETLSGRDIHKSFKDYADLKSIVGSKSFNTARDYKQYYLSNRPPGWPRDPYKTYSSTNDWVSWGEFLGSGRVSNSLLKSQRLSFEEAKVYVRKRGIKSRKEYHDMLNNNASIPLPKYPNESYKDDGWNGFVDFLKG